MVVNLIAPLILPIAAGLAAKAITALSEEEAPEKQEGKEESAVPVKAESTKSLSSIAADLYQRALLGVAEGVKEALAPPTAKEAMMPKQIAMGFKEAMTPPTAKDHQLPSLSPKELRGGKDFAWLMPKQITMGFADASVGIKEALTPPKTKEDKGSLMHREIYDISKASKTEKFLMGMTGSYGAIKIAEWLGLFE